MQTTLAADARTVETGKTTARKIRKGGKIPAVVYAKGGEAISIEIDPNALVEIFRKSGDRNTIVHLEVNGESVPCLVQEVQRHPLTRAIRHADFYRLTPGQEVQVMVPLATVGKAAGMSIGGRMRLIRRELRVICAWEDIPKSLDHDITDLDIGDMVKASELVMPKGVRLAPVKNDFNVMTLYGKRAPSAPKK